MPAVLVPVSCFQHGYDLNVGCYWRLDSLCSVGGFLD